MRPNALFAKSWKPGRAGTRLDILVSHRHPNTKCEKRARGDSSVDLKEAGLKVTLPRIRILEALENSKDRHLSAEDVYKIMLDASEEVGLATVYRVLTQFETAGIVIRHNFEGGRAVFELDDRAHHDHLVCTRCGQIHEFVDAIIEKHQDEIATKHNFQISDHALTIYGVCQNCQAERPLRHR